MHNIVFRLQGDRVALNKELAAKYEGHTLDTFADNRFVDPRRLAILVLAKNLVGTSESNIINDYLQNARIIQIGLADVSSTQRRNAALVALKKIFKQAAISRRAVINKQSILGLDIGPLKRKKIGVGLSASLLSPKATSINEKKATSTTNRRKLNEMSKRAQARLAQVS